MDTTKNTLLLVLVGCGFLFFEAEPENRPTYFLYLLIILPIIYLLRRKIERIFEKNSNRYFWSLRAIVIGVILGLIWVLIPENNDNKLIFSVYVLIMFPILFVIERKIKSKLLGGFVTFLVFFFSVIPLIIALATYECMYKKECKQVVLHKKGHKQTSNKVNKLVDKPKTK